MTKLSSSKCLNLPQGLRIISHLVAIALVAAASLTVNSAYAQLSKIQSTSVQSTASVLVAVHQTGIRRYSVNVAANFGPTSTGRRHAASAPTSHTIPADIAEIKRSEPALKYCDAKIGADATTSANNSAGYTVSVAANLTPTSIYWGQAATGLASAKITGTNAKAISELSSSNPTPTYSVAVIGQPSEVLPSATINAQTGKDLTVTDAVNTTPDTYNIVVTATYAWTDKGTSYTATGSNSVSETVGTIAVTIAAVPPRIPISGTIPHLYQISVTTIPATLPTGDTVSLAVVSSGTGVAAVTPKSISGTTVVTLSGSANSSVLGDLSLQATTSNSVFAVSNTFTVSTEPTGVTYSIYKTNQDFGFILALAFTSESGNEGDLGNCTLSEKLTTTQAPVYPPFPGFKDGSVNGKMTVPLGDKHGFPESGISPNPYLGSSCALSQALNWQDNVYTTNTGSLGSANSYTYSEPIMPSPPSGHYYFQSVMSGGYTFGPQLELSK